MSEQSMKTILEELSIEELILVDIVVKHFKETSTDPTKGVRQLRNIADNIEKSFAEHKKE